MRTIHRLLFTFLFASCVAGTAAAEYPDQQQISREQPQGVLRITADNVLAEVYLNGQPVTLDPETSADWLHAEGVVLPLQRGRNVLAVKAQDAGVVAGLLADLTVGGATLVSSEAWKVHHDAPAGWQTPYFDDSSWAPASTYGVYPGGVWGTRVQGMDGSTASWIWNEVNTLDGEVEPTVYFRFAFDVYPTWTAMPEAVLLTPSP